MVSVIQGKTCARFMLKNQKDPGASLEALGTLNVSHCPSRLELESVGLGKQRGSWVGKGRRERREIRAFVSPCSGV